jgi:23S rRNA (cytosine1962-C5)-methyltransferase
VTLRRPLARAIRAGHPWIYRDALHVPPDLRTGAAVDINDASGGFVARGLYDADSPIAVRVWTTDAGLSVDGELVAARVAAAWALRRALIDLGKTNAFRLVHGEADGLPGLVCDVYGAVAVVQVDTPAVVWLVDDLAAAVATLVPGVHHVVRKDRRGQADDAAGRITPLIGQSPRDPIWVREHGWHFAVDIARGHKTGFYLDQRENRRLVHDLAGGRRVLNLFGYTGGFAVAAALGGATRVVSVDISAPAMAVARQNFARNDLPLTPHDFVVADAFDYLTRTDERFDLVVVDPPSMAPSAAGLERALRAYTRLNALALGQAAPGALLFTASCSSHVTEANLVNVLRDAAGQARRRLRVVESRGAGPDHPVLPAFPEGRYLKALLAWVD